MMDRYDEHGNLAPNGRYVLWADHAQVSLAARYERVTMQDGVEQLLARLDDVRRMSGPYKAVLLADIRSDLAAVCGIALLEDTDSPERRADIEVERQLDRRMEEGPHE